MIQPWDKEKAKDGWTYCYPCNGYTYTVEETREHMLEVHGRSRKDVFNSWPEVVKEAV